MVTIKSAFGQSPITDNIEQKVTKRDKSVKIASKGNNEGPSRKSSRIANIAMPPGTYTENTDTGCSKKRKVPSRAPLTVQLSSKSEKPDSAAETFPCTLCDKRFKHNNSLRKHINAVHKEKLFTCDICLSSFAYLANLRRHTLKDHSGTNERFLCKECSQMFSYKHNLKAHINKFHSREM